MTNTPPATPRSNSDRLLALASLAFSSDDMTEVLDQVTAMAATLLDGCLGASVVLWNPGAESYTTASSTVPGQELGATIQGLRRRSGATRWVIDNAMPLVVPDVSRSDLGDGQLVRKYGLESFVAVPIAVDAEVLGVLYVLDTTPRRYDESDVAVLQMLAMRAASAIKTADLVANLRSSEAAYRDAVFSARSSRKQADAVARVGNSLMHMTDPSKDLPVILDVIGQAFGADRMILIELDTETECITNELIAGLDANRIESHTYQDLMNGLTGWAILNDKIAVSDEPDARESEEARALRERNGSGPLVVAPLVSSDGPSGTLTVIRRRGKAPFSPSEVATVGTMASQLALALERLRLLAINRRLAHTDELTGIPNRRQLELAGEDVLETSRRYLRPMSVLLLDADDFKAVNDTLGHDAGDDALKRIAAACASGARAADIVGRWGGDEFLAILPETDGAGAQVVAQRIIEHHRDDRLTLSVGIATTTGDEAQFTELVRRADAAMYRAKRVAGASVA